MVGALLVLFVYWYLHVEQWCLGWYAMCIARILSVVFTCTPGYLEKWGKAFLGPSEEVPEDQSFRDKHGNLKGGPENRSYQKIRVRYTVGAIIMYPVMVLCVMVLGIGWSCGIWLTGLLFGLIYSGFMWLLAAARVGGQASQEEQGLIPSLASPPHSTVHFA